MFNFLTKITHPKHMKLFAKSRLPEDKSTNNHRTADKHVDMTPNTTFPVTHTQLHIPFDVLMLSCSDDNFIEEEGGNVVQTLWLQEAQTCTTRKDPVPHSHNSPSLPLTHTHRGGQKASQLLAAFSLF